MIPTTVSLSLTTPALLFPAVSLLLLAYTNRYMGLASVTRSLYAEYSKTHDEKILHQIDNLRTRITLIQWMQILGIASLFLCTITMFLIYMKWQQVAELIFAISLISMIASLGLSLPELIRSSDALNILLSDLEEEGRLNHKRRK